MLGTDIRIKKPRDPDTMSVYLQAGLWHRLRGKLDSGALEPGLPRRDRSAGARPVNCLLGNVKTRRCP